MKNITARCLAGALMLVSGPASMPAAAQPRQAQLQIPVPPAEAIRIPCCRCLDGSRQSVNINTRTAPWRVDPPGPPIGFQPVVAATNPAWAPVPPAGWVGPAGNPTAVGDYTYQVQIYVPRCVIPAQIVVSGRFAADNSARVVLDGTQIAASQGTPNYGFLPGSITPFSAPLGPGLHTLQVVVRNIGGPTGMILQGTITATCPRDLELGPPPLGPAPDRPPGTLAVEPGA